MRSKEKGSKNRSKSNFASQIVEKQSVIQTDNDKITSITTNIDALKAYLKAKRIELKSIDKEVTKLEAKRAKANQETTEEAKRQKPRLRLKDCWLAA